MHVGPFKAEYATLFVRLIRKEVQDSQAHVSVHTPSVLGLVCECTQSEVFLPWSSTSNPLCAVVRTRPTLDRETLSYLFLAVNKRFEVDFSKSHGGPHHEEATDRKKGPRVKKVERGKERGMERGSEGATAHKGK